MGLEVKRFPVNADFRTERDSMGEMQVPAGALYGAQTARAIENFPISGLPFPRGFIRALGLIKKHAARTNSELGLLPADTAAAIEQAAQEVIDGRHDGEFAVDIFQTGSGTSTNMNANEVIATRATQLMGKGRVHPNDDVNRGQSSNDVIPTAIHVAASEMLTAKLVPSLEVLRKELAAKAKEFHAIIKIGRTHLQDATPIRLGQEFGGYARQVELGIARLRDVLPRIGELALGGTAVGTGINTHPEFAARTISRISSETGLAFREAENHFEAQAARDAAVEASAALRTVAVSLMKVANDIRFLGSGPRLGYGELRLPATQPGSSIMPGKVNPVMSEMLMQVCAQVIGNDAAITIAASFGNFELNVMMPVIARNLLEAIELLANGSRVFALRCVAGLAADVGKCEQNIEQSLALCTPLAPIIGYDKAAEIAKVAYSSGRTVREVALERSGLPAAELQRIMDPKSMC